MPKAVLENVVFDFSILISEERRHIKWQKDQSILDLYIFGMKHIRSGQIVFVLLDALFDRGKRVVSATLDFNGRNS